MLQQAKTVNCFDIVLIVFKDVTISIFRRDKIT